MSTRSSPTTPAVTLRDDRLRLVILPELGASFAHFDALLPDGTEVPVFRPAPDGTTDPGETACYPLVPWSNRIRSGFLWNGERFTLERNVPGEPYPLHGDGWQRQWTVREASSTEAILTLESSRQSPFDYAATMRCALVAGALEVEMSVAHYGERSAPYGLGLHPWLPRTPDVLVHAPCTGVVGEAPDHLPTDWFPIDAVPDWDFRSPHPLPRRWINNLFTGWTGSATINWPARGVRLAVDTAPALPYYIVYSPSPESSFFCFEPVSHAIDAHNAPSPTHQGLRPLRTGESFSTTWRFRPEVALEIPPRPQTQETA